MKLSKFNVLEILVVAVILLLCVGLLMVAVEHKKLTAKMDSCQLQIADIYNTIYSHKQPHETLLVDDADIRQSMPDQARDIQKTFADLRKMIDETELPFVKRIERLEEKVAWLESMVEGIDVKAKLLGKAVGNLVQDFYKTDVTIEDVLADPKIQEELAEQSLSRPPFDPELINVEGYEVDKLDKPTNKPKKLYPEFDTVDKQLDEIIRWLQIQWADIDSIRSILEEIIEEEHSIPVRIKK